MILGICNNASILEVLKLVKLFILIIKIAVPIILVVVLMIDFISAIKVGNEDLLKKAEQKAVKRFIAAVLIFLVPTLVNVVIKISMPNTQVGMCLNNATNEGVYSAYYNNSNELVKKAQETKLSYDVEIAKSSLGKLNEDDKNYFLDLLNNIVISEEKAKEETQIFSDVNNNIDYNKTRTFISKMEGTNTSFSECNNGKGYYVQKDCFSNYTITNNVRGTGYGITNFALSEINNCTKVTSEEKNKYFTESTFVGGPSCDNPMGACIPKDVVDRASLCIIDSHESYIKSAYNSYCKKTSSYFNTQQLTALIDFSNSGPGYVQKAVKEYCNTLNNGKTLKEAQEAMFKEVFKKENANPTCAFEARRDCEARMFFDGDTTCGNQSPYISNFNYKYAKFIDINYYNNTNSKCSKR